MKKTIGDTLKYIGSHFLMFVKRIFVFAFFYGFVYCVSCMAALLIAKGMKQIGIHNDVSMIIGRIFLTVAPIIPTCVYARCEKEDLNGEFNMDLCFVVWVATIVFAWWIW